MSGLTSREPFFIPAERWTRVSDPHESSFFCGSFIREAGTFPALPFERGLEHGHGTLRDQRITPLAFRRYIFFRLTRRGSMRTDPYQKVIQSIHD